MAATPIISLPPNQGGQQNYGLITYGNFTFSPFRNVRIECVPAYDEADRVVTHLQYKLRCYDCIIQSQTFSSQQPSMAAMQSALTEPGQRLLIQNIGFDNGVDTLTRSDLIWGPKPRLLSMRPYGEICWAFDWEVEFNVSRCADQSVFSPGLFGSGVLMAWNYEVSFTVGANGIVSDRTTRGYLQVFAPRVGNDPNTAQNEFTSVLFNVDAAWDRLTLNIPYGFRRVSNNRTINKAKNRIDFTIVEEEFPAAPFPPGIVNAEARLEVASQQPGLQTWLGTLRATYEVAVGFSKALAVSKFLTLLNDRVLKLKNAMIAGGLEGATIIPLRMAISRELYSRETEIAVTFTFQTTADALLQQSGIWQPLPENDWQKWNQSLQQAGITANKGYSKVGFDNTEDRLVTICLPWSREEEGNTPEDHFDSDGASNENTGTFTDQSSPGAYLLYRSAVNEVRSENFVVHRYAQNYAPGVTGFQDNMVEYQSAPDNFIVMTGEAVRVDQMPDPPQVLTVGGMPVELLKKILVPDDKPTTLVFGHKLYRASWELWYRVKGDPGVTSPTAVPLLLPAELEPGEVA